MCELYRSERVSVLDGGAFGKGTAGFVRLCFATERGDAARGVRAHPPFCKPQSLSGGGGRSAQRAQRAKRAQRAQRTCGAGCPSALPKGRAVDSLMTVTATEELTDRTQGMRDR